MNAEIFKSVFLLIIFLSLFCCKKSTSSNDLMVFDVNSNFPEKTFNIEDIADIEYLVLKISDDDYIFSSFDIMTDNYIICRGEGGFKFFSAKTGKPVSIVSRRGNGPEEYIGCISSTYSETKDELFVYNL